MTIKRFNMKPLYSLILGLAIAAAAFHASAESALLANKVFSGQSWDADTIKAVLLGKKSTVGDNRVVIIIARAGDNQEAFLSAHLGMTSDQFGTYLRRLYMTGGGAAPKVVDTEAEALKVAAETPGGICLGDSTKVDASLVVLAK